MLSKHIFDCYQSTSLSLECMTINSHCTLLFHSTHLQSVRMVGLASTVSSSVTVAIHTRCVTRRMESAAQDARLDTPGPDAKSVSFSARFLIDNVNNENNIAYLTASFCACNSQWHTLHLPDNLSGLVNLQPFTNAILFYARSNTNRTLESLCPRPLLHLHPSTIYLCDETIPLCCSHLLSVSAHLSFQDGKKKQVFLLA